MDQPERIGDYVIVGHLASGAMNADLYRAQKHGRGPIVCIKRLPDSEEFDEKFVAAFTREIENAIELRHPNIVRVFEWGHDDGYWYAMQLVDGPDLSSLLLQHRRVPPHVVAHIGASLGHALTYVHHREGARGPLIHNDVTPHNVLVDGSGAVRLSDFGVAKALATTGAGTRTQSRGKEGYLAPEQYDECPTITSSVDLFALGLVLWQALIGTHPYLERIPAERHADRYVDRWLPKLVRGNERRSVPEAAPRAPAGLCDVIERLLQPVSSRISTAEEVVAALEPHTRPTSAEALGRLASETPIGAEE